MEGQTKTVVSEWWQGTPSIVYQTIAGPHTKTNLWFSRSRKTRPTGPNHNHAAQPHMQIPYSLNFKLSQTVGLSIREEHKHTILPFAAKLILKYTVLVYMWYIFKCSAGTILNIVYSVCITGHFSFIPLLFPLGPPHKLRLYICSQKKCIFEPDTLALPK